jgi:hypothetical protein
VPTLYDYLLFSGERTYYNSGRVELEFAKLILATPFTSSSLVYTLLTKLLERLLLKRDWLRDLSIGHDDSSMEAAIR